MPSEMYVDALLLVSVFYVHCLCRCMWNLLLENTHREKSASWHCVGNKRDLRLSAPLQGTLDVVRSEGRNTFTQCVCSVVVPPILADRLVRVRELFT